MIFLNQIFARISSGIKTPFYRWMEFVNFYILFFSNKKSWLKHVGVYWHIYNYITTQPRPSKNYLTRKLLKPKRYKTQYDTKNIQVSTLTPTEQGPPEHGPLCSWLADDLEWKKNHKINGKLQ